MINLQGVGAWGSICKMCVFFSVVFFIFYNNYLFSLGMYWINVCTCSVPS